MPYLMTPAHREQITSLSAAERFFHFIDKVVEHEALWTLKKGDELLLFSDEESRMIIPVWPHPDYSQVFATGEWKDAPAIRIDLDTFLNRTLTSCIEDDVHFLVFPISEEKGAVSTAEDLKQELIAAQENTKEAKPRTLDDLPEISDEILAQL